MKSPDKAGAPRKPYASPRIQRYGSVRSITRNNGTMSNQADGGMQKAKTA